MGLCDYRNWSNGLKKQGRESANLNNLSLYSQHTQTVDTRHRVTVADKVASLPPVLGQPPLPLFFADGSVVDRQVFHHTNPLRICFFVLLPSPNSPFSLCLTFNFLLQASLLVFTVQAADWESSVSFDTGSLCFKRLLGSLSCSVIHHLFTQTGSMYLEPPPLYDLMFIASSLLKAYTRINTCVVGCVYLRKWLYFSTGNNFKDSNWISP